MAWSLFKQVQISVERFFKEKQHFTIFNPNQHYWQCTEGVQRAESSTRNWKALWNEEQYSLDP
jgi:hypothetical protein